MSVRSYANAYANSRACACVYARVYARARTRRHTKIRTRCIIPIKQPPRGKKIVILINAGKYLKN